MKIGTTELLKFKRLKGRLKLSEWQVIGLLESLWMFTSKNAPAGDIGKCTDEDIAFGIEWDGEPSELVQVLVDTRWIDRHETHRLVIHDWFDHVPNWLKGNFKSHNKTFIGQHSENREQVTRQPAKQPAEPTEQVAKQPAKQTAEQATEQPANSTSPPRHVNSRHANSIQSTTHQTSESLENAIVDGSQERGKVEQGSSSNPTEPHQNSTAVSKRAKAHMRATPEFDPWISEFVQKFNATEGTTKISGMMSKRTQDSLWALRDDPWFNENYEKALSMFPLPYFKNRGYLVGITKFLEPNFIEGVVEGKYQVDFSNAPVSPKPDLKTSQAKDMLEKLAARGAGEFSITNTEIKAITHG